MIEFHNDHLVPPELCRSLYQVVSKEHHVPVRFHNRREKRSHEERGSQPLGWMHLKGRGQPAYIDINLNPIYHASRWRPRPRVLAPSSAVPVEIVDGVARRLGAASQVLGSLQRSPSS